MPDPDPRRGIRAALLGTALGALTLAGHTAAGGGADVVGIGLVLIVSIALGAALGGGRLRAPLVFAMLAGGQALLHAVLTFTSAHNHGGTEAAAPWVVMLLGHTIAAVLATVLIVHADRIAAAWFAFLSAVLGASSEPAGVLGRLPDTASRPMAAGAMASDFALGVLVRRGPPSAPPAH